MLMVMMLTSCNRSPLSGLIDAYNSYLEFFEEVNTWGENFSQKAPAYWSDDETQEYKEYMDKAGAKLERLEAAIAAEASHLDGATLPVANDEISEIEPLRMELVYTGKEPKFRLNGKFKIEKDIELFVWNDYHAERLKNGKNAQVWLAGPKVVELDVAYPSSEPWNRVACVSDIPVSVENGVIIAKAGTIIEIKDAEWSIRTYTFNNNKQGKIWLQPIGISVKP